jgi:hypothetical protein
MMVQNSPERRPYDEREERYRQHQAPNLLLVRHF